MPHLFGKIAGSVAFLTCLSLSFTAQAAIITNGGFNADLEGWTVINQPGANGNWFHTTGGRARLGPRGGLSILAPNEGTGYAHTAQTDPTSQVLFQDIVLEADTTHFLSFDWYTQDWARSFFDAGTMDYNPVNPNQHFRVDLVSTDFDDWFGPDSSADILANILAPVAEPAPVNSWNSLTFDLTPWSGESVRLAFRQVDNQYFFNAGVDNVIISSDPNGGGNPSVPEPSALFGLMALGLFGLYSRTTPSTMKPSSES
ncbi:MAG: PEP-CTERM sorting domain-containing protein [Cyanobacteria bacterium P01_A01_bin.137]